MLIILAKQGVVFCGQDWVIYVRPECAKRQSLLQWHTLTSAYLTECILQ